MIKRSITATILTTAFLLFIFCGLAYADIKLKIAVVNPSDTESQTAPVRYDLPKGLTPNEITDIGNMELKYDFDKGNYYLYQVVKLKPAEKQVLEIRLRDIWLTPKKELDFLKDHTKSLTDALKNTKHAKIGDTLARKIIERLNAIEKKEADTNLTITDHINLYYEDVNILSETKEDIGMLENLVLDIGGIVEERVQVPSTLAISIKGDEANTNIVELTVKVSNPSKTAKQVAEVKYILPEEVTPRYVVDRSGLDMGYNFAKQSFQVYKNNVILEPSEVKNYIIKIVDIWRIPDIETDTLSAHTANLILLLKGTEYLAQAGPIAEKITQGIAEIKRKQSLKASPDEHIAYYRKNMLLLDEVKKYVAQLEKLASQSGASVGVTIKEAEVQRGGGAKEKRARGYEGIDYIVKSIFKGKAPTVATTWRIIYVILIFLGILGALFFWLWYSQVARIQKREEKIEPAKPEQKRDEAKKE